MSALIPYLVVRDARAAISWYGEAFGAHTVGDPYLDGDRVGHAELDIGGAIVTAIAGALQRLELGKAGLPIAQDMLRHPQVGAQLADGSEGVRSLFAGRQGLTYFAIRSRMS